MKPNTNPENKISSAATAMALVGALTASVANNTQAAVTDSTGQAPIVQAHSSEHTKKLDAFTSYQEAFDYCTANSASMGIADKNYARVRLSAIAKMQVENALNGIATSTDIASWCQLPENAWAKAEPFKTSVTAIYNRLLAKEKEEADAQQADAQQDEKPAEPVKPKPALGSKEAAALQKAEAEAAREAARIAKLTPRIIADTNKSAVNASKWDIVKPGTGKIDTLAEVDDKGGELEISFPKNGKTMASAEFGSSIPLGNYTLELEIEGGNIVYWHGKDRLELSSGTHDLVLVKNGFRLGAFVDKLKPQIKIKKFVINSAVPTGAELTQK